MKYLIILAIALGVLWLLKNKRRLDHDDADKPAQAASRAQTRTALPATEIVACHVCDLHLPRSEALTDARGGIYCGAAHRQQAGG